jgi:hypothetical protein
LKRVRAPDVVLVECVVAIDHDIRYGKRAAHGTDHALCDGAKGHDPHSARTIEFFLLVFKPSAASAATGFRLFIDHAMMCAMKPPRNICSHPAETNDA